MNVALPKIRTESGKKTFAYQGAILFNKLPSDLKTEKSLLRFKSGCKVFNFDFLSVYFVMYLLLIYNCKDDIIAYPNN